MLGNDAFQETPIVEICRRITKHHYLLTRVEDIARVVKEAFHIATPAAPGRSSSTCARTCSRSRPSPNWDVRRWTCPATGRRRSAPAGREERWASRRSGRARSRSSTPAAASPTPGAAAELKEFAELTGIPVGLTVHGLGNFPADHYLCLQMLGMHGTVYSNYAINDADLLLRLGVRFDDRVTGKLTEFAKHGKIVHVDIDKSEIHKNKFAHIPVHGDVKFALAGAQPDAPRGEERRPDRRRALPGWWRQIDAWREADPLKFPEPGRLIPQYAITRLWEILRDRKQLDDTIITTGVGQHQMWAAQFFHFNNRRGSGSPAAASARWASACRRRWGRGGRTRTPRHRLTATAAS